MLSKKWSEIKNNRQTLGSLLCSKKSLKDKEKYYKILCWPTYDKGVFFLRFFIERMEIHLLHR